MRTGRPTTLAFDGMVATSHYLATGAGVQTLREGGSAADAVIAANAVLTVVYPDQTSIGGDCFLLYHEAGTRSLHALNGTGRTPVGASADAVRHAGHDGMPVRGIHAVTVPGTVDAWCRIADRFGRLGLDRLLQPAIDYARNGFPVSPRLARGIAKAAEMLGADPYAASIYLPGDSPPKAGQRLVLSDLAESLASVAGGGRSAFYEGAIAEGIVGVSDALGGAFAAEQAALGSWGSAAHLHPLIEAKKRAFRIRDERIGDPAFAELDVAHLLSDAYARECWADYDPTRASGGGPTSPGDTVYLCAVDRDGNAASMIQSIYKGFGSGVVVPGTGIVLQNRGASFRLEDGHPNSFAGGKRPLHTLMPGMLYRDGDLWGPIGTQGGDAQAQVHLQLVTNLVDFGMDPQEAVEAPRWVAGGTAADPATFVTVEEGISPATRADLEAKGHAVAVTGTFNADAGHAQMILRDPVTGLLRGGADPRADGAALGL